MSVASSIAAASAPVMMKAMMMSMVMAMVISTVRIATAVIAHYSDLDSENSKTLKE